MKCLRVKKKRKAFNDEMVNKTWQYQKEYGFEVSPIKGHEFWNNQADAFKHAYMQAHLSTLFLHLLFFYQGNIITIVI